VLKTDIKLDLTAQFLQTVMFLWCFLHHANTTQFKKLYKGTSYLTKLMLKQTFEGQPDHWVDFNKPKITGDDN